MRNVASLRVSDRLWGQDPGGLRLRNALRSTAATTLTGIISVAWAMHHHSPLTVAALAILFAMISPLFVRETAPAGFVITLTWIYLTASAAYVAAAALGTESLFGDLGFLCVFFIGILCQACGPRALGCALASIVTYYLGLYLAPTALEVRESLLLSLPALVVVTLVVRVILPVKPAVILQRAIKAVLARASRLESLLAGAVSSASDHASGRASGTPFGSASAGNAKSSVARLDRQISLLNEAALALEEHLSLLPMLDRQADNIRERLVDLEVAAGQCHYARAVVDASGSLAGLPALRAAMARLRETVDGRGKASLLPTPESRSPRFGMAAASALSFTAKWQDFSARLSWLHAGRATTAALLAMLLGHSLSPERWFWAVISTFVVFLGTRSRADTIHRGLERVGGTLAGAFVSAVLALSLHGMTSLMLLAMVLCVFGWSYFILSSYSRGVFFITVLVGLVYSELGFAIGPLVTIRIEEVLLGCVISFAVAALVFPVSASSHIDTRVLGILKALRSVVETHAQGLPAAQAQRQLEKRWHELRVAFRPFQTQRVFVWNPGCEMVSGALLACMHWTRSLTTEAIDHGNAVPSSANRDAHPQAFYANAIQFIAIVAQLDSLIRQYAADYRPAALASGRAMAPSQATSASTRLATAAAAAAPGDTSMSDSTARQAQMLTQLDACVNQLSERLRHSPAQRSGVRWALGTSAS